MSLAIKQAELKDMSRNQILAVDEFIQKITVAAETSHGIDGKPQEKLVPLQQTADEISDAMKQAKIALNDFFGTIGNKDAVIDTCVSLNARDREKDLKTLRSRLSKLSISDQVKEQFCNLLADHHRRFTKTTVAAFTDRLWKESDDSEKK